MSTNIFEQASRKKLRFVTPNGKMSAEDLWELPLQARSGDSSLDDTAKRIAAQIRTAEEESFVTKAATSPTNELRLKIVKHIIAYKIAAEERATNNQLKSQRRQKLLEAKGKKLDEGLGEMSVEELDAELAALDD